MLFFAVAGTVLSINAAEKFGSGLVSGIILAATINMFFGYLLMPIISTMIAFKAYCATLKKWCQSLKNQSQLLERDGLCKYLKALDMAGNVLSDSVFHFSVGASMCGLVSIYRAYSLSIGKKNKIYRISAYSFRGNYSFLEVETVSALWQFFTS